MIRCLNCGFELTLAHVHSPHFVRLFEYLEDESEGTAACFCPDCRLELESAEKPHFRPNTWLEREDPSSLAGLSQVEYSSPIEPPSLSDAPLGADGEADDLGFRLQVRGDEIVVVAAEDNPFHAVVITQWKPGMQNALKRVKGARKGDSTGQAAKQPAPASAVPTEDVSAPVKPVHWSDLV